MRPFERIFLNLINAWMLTFAGFAVGFLITYFEIDTAPQWAVWIAGALAGLYLWWFYRGRLLELLLHNFKYQLAVTGVYMVGLFGFFMGVPVFNILPGILLAFICGVAAREEDTPADEFARKLRQVNVIALAILALFLAASAVVALEDPYTAGNLEGMLGLSEVTQGTIILIISVGGLGLMVVQWLLAHFVGNWARASKA